MSNIRFNLVQDRKGLVWDLLLYIPTVAALLSIAAKFWFGGDINLAYLFVFLASFFFIAGFNRIVKTRLMLLPSAPIAIEIVHPMIRLELKGGGCADLVKEQKYYSDYAGRSFGLTGLDSSAKRVQYVFHKGQFATVAEYEKAQDKLRACC